MIIVFSEAAFHPPTSLNARELHAVTEAARLFGCRVYPVPPDFETYGTAEDVLAYVPHFDKAVPGVWVGYIPSLERYTALYEAARARSIHLLNTPAQYQTAMEFDRFYPLLGQLTPASRVVHSIDDCATIGAELGFPVFVKGAVKSNKEQGWQACVADNEAALATLTQQLLARPARSRGRVIVRKLVMLRHAQQTPDGFPLGREYRVFVYQQRILAFGYYWDEHADPYPLLPADDDAIRGLAIEAARRVGVSFLAVDIGQLEPGEWSVIEVGDAQFSGLSHVPVLELWSKVKDITLERSNARPTD